MSAIGQIRCSVYLHGDVDPDDAELIEQLNDARPGRRAQRFLAIVRTGLDREAAGRGAVPHDPATGNPVPKGRRLVIHLKLRQTFEPRIVAEIQGAANRSARLRELAIRGLRSKTDSSSANAVGRATAPDAVLGQRRSDSVDTDKLVATAVGDPLDAMLTQFLAMTEKSA